MFGKCNGFNKSTAKLFKIFLDKDFVSEDFKAEEFAGRIKNSMQISQMAVTLKHSYDDILCNGGFVQFDNVNKLIVFDYEIIIT